MTIIRIPPSRCRRAGIVLGLLAAGASLVALAPPAHAEDGESTPRPRPPAFSAQDADLHAAVLAAEDRRLTEIRTVTSLARWQGKNWKTPYRLGTAAGYTLVLTPSSSAYTIGDLLKLAPQTFRRMSDGSYLLSEHIVVMARATLRLSAPGGLTLRLASDHDGFSTIVSLGGELELAGEDRAPVNVTSWDPAAGGNDPVTIDGRAYIRAIGGQFSAQHVTASHLGFWSGRTGGIALTGTDRPNTGAIESGRTATDESATPSILDDVTQSDPGPLPGEPGQNLDFAVPALDYVSTQMSNVTVEHNAFGLFISGANGVKLTDSSFTDNDLGGVVLHRFVTNGVINRTSSNRNVGDGFTLARATTGIAINEATAAENSGSGFSLDGRPLADGPSATGAPVRMYGSNSVSNSTARTNGHYGIEVLGGSNIAVNNNLVQSHDMGVVIAGSTRRVSVTGNTVRDSERHGVALLDGIGEANVSGNVIERSSTGVYVRESSALVKGNTVQRAESHGVALIGQVEGMEVSFNVLAGSGASALDTTRSHGRIVDSTNNLEGWNDTTPWFMWFKKLLRPMNVLWLLVAVLLFVSAVRRRRDPQVIEHPYAAQIQQLRYLETAPVDMAGLRMAAAE